MIVWELIKFYDEDQIEKGQFWFADVSIWLN